MCFKKPRRQRNCALWLLRVSRDGRKIPITIVWPQLMQRTVYILLHLFWSIRRLSEKMYYFLMQAFVWVSKCRWMVQYLIKVCFHPHGKWRFDFKSQTQLRLEISIRSYLRMCFHQQSAALTPLHCIIVCFAHHCLVGAILFYVIMYSNQFSYIGCGKVFSVTGHYCVYIWIPY